MRLVWVVAAAVAAAGELVARCEGCTTFALPASSTSEGAAVTAHTTDCEECDPRLALVPGRRWAAGSRHAVYGINSVFPRKSDGARATVYQGVPHVEPIAWIPEVEETLGIWESSYSLMNEKGLTMGESSCSSKIPAAGLGLPDADGKLGTAYFCIGALMQLGLERCGDAVCAIRTMGALAERYGFYGESLMGGETLTIADVSGAAWVFHVMQSFTSNSSAIWVAQRVPEGHAAVIANEFTIQQVPVFGGEQVNSGFMWSGNLVSEARAAGFFPDDGSTGEFNFQQVYGTATVLGTHRYATMRQQWIYNKWAPSLRLPLRDSPSQYHFSYPVDRPLSLEAAIDALRGNYEGTDWDLTKGVLAGPFGNPKRFEGGPGLAVVKGAMPRPISIPRTSHVHIGVAHPTRAAALYGPDESGTTVFAPFFSATLSEAQHVPLNDTARLYAHSYQVGRRDRYAYRASAWWAFDMVANAVNFCYSNMTAEFVVPAVQKHQADMLRLWRRGPDTSAATRGQQRLVEAWWDLYDLLVVTYNDGTFNYAKGHDPNKPAQRIGYPAAFLKAIAFDDDFWKAESVDNVCAKKNKSNNNNQPGAVPDRWTIIAERLALLILGGMLGTAHAAWRARSSVAHRTTTCTCTCQSSSSAACAAANFAGAGQPLLLAQPA